MSVYDPLYHWLRSLKNRRIVCSFEDIENVLGRQLPPSAKSHSEWWANESGKARHAQCRSWLAAGYRTAYVDLAHQTVEFIKT